MNALRLLARGFPRGSRRVPSASEYDYIIIGAGSAGCLLANELACDPANHRVLLLEAGGWDWNPLIHIPAGVYSVFKDTSVNWNMTSEPEPHAAALPRPHVCSSAEPEALAVNRRRLDTFRAAQLQQRPPAEDQVSEGGESSVCGASVATGVSGYEPFKPCISAAKYTTKAASPAASEAPLFEVPPKPHTPPASS